MLSGEVPMGLGMALAENAAAMNSFALLSADARAAFIDGAKRVESREEMRAYVGRLCSGG